MLSWVGPTLPCLLVPQAAFVPHQNGRVSLKRTSAALPTCRRPSRQVTQVMTSASDVQATPETNETETLPTGIRLGFMTTEEISEPIPLEVTGQLPSYLGSGTYYRNGPGVFEVTHKDGLEYIPEHWFDVIGMVHAFFINARDGTVHYRNKNVGEEIVRTVKAVNRDDYTAVNFSREYRPASFLSRLRALFGPMTRDPDSGRIPFNVLVTLQEVPGKGILNASTDANVFHRLDPSTLEKVEKYDASDLGTNLQGFYSSSHGMLDDETGEYFNYVVDPSVGKVEYQVYRINVSGKAEVMTTFKDYWYYIHSFALTKNYVIMILWPNQVDLLRLLARKSFIDACSMRPNTKTKFVVISRKSNDVACIYESEPFFCFHTINAFERDDDIVIDLSWYENNEIMRDLRIENIVGEKKIADSRPVRFTLTGISEAISTGPKTPRRATSRQLADIGLEFAFIAPSKRRRAYRYAYGVSDVVSRRFQGDVTKLDVQTGVSVSWTSPGIFVGEPIFVPDPRGEAEDEGSLIVVVLDSETQKSSLVVLDARSMTETARAIVPMPLPLGFHGSFHA